jgi:hypothetical protein
VVWALFQKMPSLLVVAVAFEILFEISGPLFAVSVSMVPRYSACVAVFMHFPSETLIDELLWSIVKFRHFPTFNLRL